MPMRRPARRRTAPPGPVRPDAVHGHDRNFTLRHGVRSSWHRIILQAQAALKAIRSPIPIAISPTLEADAPLTTWPSTLHEDCYLSEKFMYYGSGRPAPRNCGRRVKPGHARNPAMSALGPTSDCSNFELSGSLIRSRHSDPAKRASRPTAFVLQLFRIGAVQTPDERGPQCGRLGCPLGGPAPLRAETGERHVRSRD